MHIPMLQFSEDIMPDTIPGAVVLGCGGNLQTWLRTITSDLTELHIISGNAQEVWANVFGMETTGGRVDLVLSFTPRFIDHDKLATWLSTTPRVIPIESYIKKYGIHHTAAPAGETIQ